MRHPQARTAVAPAFYRRGPPLESLRAGAAPGTALASLLPEPSTEAVPMTRRLFWQILKEAGQSWYDDKAQRMGAALAYYSAFSLAPLLLIAIALAGLIFGEQAARGEILEQIQHTVGPTAAQAIEEML